MRHSEGTEIPIAASLSSLPSVHEVLEREDLLPLLEVHSRDQLAKDVRSVLARLRERIRANRLNEQELATALSQLPQLLRIETRESTRPRLRRVINATGVLLQTNLGRAPLSPAALDQIHEVARGYCNLEYDLDAGKRSRRDAHFEDLICDLVRARLPLSSALARSGSPSLAAAVVNNCAAATFLALNALAEGSEVIVSRGELVEIGGGFRIPEILAKSGAILREVGTTNKTRLKDYAAAISPATKLILRVHRSNFRIEGFTEQPSLEELVALGRRVAVPIFDDQGTGCVLDLAAMGLPGESSWLSSVAAGVSLTACSGDKLMGGPQCGILVGDSAIVDQLRENPLFRALRVDKLTYAALEATIRAYLTGGEHSLPLAQMLHIPAEEIRLRCEVLASVLNSARFRAEVVSARSVVGGGTTPGASVPSFALALTPCSGQGNEDALAAHLRRLETPIVSRISDGRVLLDLRTVAPEDDATLQGLLCTFGQSAS